ncbi:hypothetical protein EG028_06800 [Chitinophaga barathri]|uniref:LVIVD repeat-containing protein n=1 Tax=Chitinophaga barathri TaxID=1647451 RepID=A0A3N4MJ78_9BACT|nr:hypothetical protein EG028_06800 [Chitinophaga barathri]
MLLVVTVCTSCGDLFDFGFSGRNADRVGYRETGEVQAWVPVYAEPDDVSGVALKDKRPTQEGGKIFALGNKLFQVETGVGLHIIDYSDKTKPVKVGFLNVPGCQEVALKGSAVYTNSFENMLVLDLSAFPDVKVKATLPNVFPELKYPRPPGRGGYYVCPDVSKGRVIRWKQETVLNPQCAN